MSFGSNIWGKLLDIAGDAYIAGKATFPQLSDSFTPKIRNNKYVSKIYIHYYINVPYTL